MSEIAEIAPVQGPTPKHGRRQKIITFCVVILLNLGMLAFLVSQLLTPAPKSASDLLIGHPAPNFSLALLGTSTGKNALSLPDFKSKAIVLNFWASWCAPCKDELPLLENAWKQMQAQGKDIVFLGIDFQESNSAAASFLQQNGITYSAGLDTNGSVAAKYGINSLPDTYFIDRSGTVKSKVLQQLTAQALASNLQLIL